MGRSGALSGAFWGLLFGLVFFVPLPGAAIGAAMVCLTGNLVDVGIDDNFITQVRDRITHGTSALFVLGGGILRGGRGPFGCRAAWRSSVNGGRNDA